MTVPLIDRFDNLPVPNVFDDTRIRVSDRNNQVYCYKDGKWIPEITWTNCADKMPPDGWVIIEDSWGMERTNTLKSDYGICVDLDAKWTEFTKEKWEELNK